MTRLKRAPNKIHHEIRVLPSRTVSLSTASLGSENQTCGARVTTNTFKTCTGRPSSSEKRQKYTFGTSLMPCGRRHFGEATLATRIQPRYRTLTLVMARSARREFHPLTCHPVPFFHSNTSTQAARPSLAG